MSEQETLIDVKSTIDLKAELEKLRNNTEKAISINESDCMKYEEEAKENWPKVKNEVLSFIISECHKRSKLKYHDITFKVQLTGDSWQISSKMDNSSVYKVTGPINIRDILEDLKVSLENCGYVCFTENYSNGNWHFEVSWFKCCVIL